MKKFVLLCVLALAPFVTSCGDPTGSAPSVVTSPGVIASGGGSLRLRDTNPPPPKLCPDGSPVSILDESCPDPIH